MYEVTLVYILLADDYSWHGTRPLLMVRDTGFDNVRFRRDAKIKSEQRRSMQVIAYYFRKRITVLLLVSLICLYIIW